MEFSIAFEEVPLRIGRAAVEILAYGSAEIYAPTYGSYEVECIRLAGDDGDVTLHPGHVLWPFLAPSILIKCHRQLAAAYMDAEAAMPRPRRTVASENRMQPAELV